MQVVSSPTREKYPLNKKKIFKKSFLAIIGYLFFAIIAMFLVPFLNMMGASEGGLNEQTQTFVNDASGWLVAAVIGFGIIYCIVVVLYQIWYFKVYFYNLDDNYIVIRKHPITPKEITVPYERVQDVYVDQDLLDRVLGLYDVHLSSATISSGMEAHIDGLVKTGADGLRSELLGTVSAKIKRQKGPLLGAENVSQS